MVLDSTACHPSYAVWEQGIYFFTPGDKQDRKDLSLYEGSTGRTRKIMTIEQREAMYMAVSPTAEQSFARKPTSPART